MIELLVVIAILGILSAIAIPQYLGYKRNAIRNSILESKNQIKNQLQGCLDSLSNGQVFDTDCNAGTAAVVPAGIAACVAMYVPAAANNCGGNGATVIISPYAGVATGPPVGAPLFVGAAANGQTAIVAGANFITVTTSVKNAADTAWVSTVDSVAQD